MRIVHVEEFFHPDAGYQVNLLSRLQAREGHEVIVVAAELERMPDFLTGFFGRDQISERDKAFEGSTGVEIVRLPLLGYFSGRAIFRPSLFKRVGNMQPDVVFVHGIDTLTGILFIWLSRWLRYPVVFDCHMLEMASMNRFRKVFRRFFSRFVAPVVLRNRLPVIRVVDSDYVQKCLGIPLNRTELLSLGTDTSLFQPDEERRRSVKRNLGVEEKAFLVVYAGKLDETKGGRFLAQSIRSSLSGGGRPVRFLIIGTADGAYGEELEALFRQSENGIIRLPTQRYMDLPQFYQAADLVVFPRQCSLSFFDAQACGCPVLFEANEVNARRVSNENAFLFRSGDASDFRAKIEWLSSLDDSVLSRVRAQAREYVLSCYDFVPTAKECTNLLRRSIEAWRKRAVGG